MAYNILTMNCQIVPDMLFHVICCDQIATDITDFFAFPLVSAALVRQVDVLKVESFLVEHLLTVVPTAHIVSHRVP